MSILGLGSKPQATAKKVEDKKSASKSENGASQNDEAKAILAKMEAKKDAGDCPFC